MTATAPAALERLCEILNDRVNRLTGGPDRICREAAAVIATRQGELKQTVVVRNQHHAQALDNGGRALQAEAKLREIADLADAALTGDADHDYTSLHRIRSIARGVGA